VVHLVRQIGVEVAERVVAQRRQVHHRVRRHFGQVLGGHVPQIHPQRRHRIGSRADDAVGEQPGVEADHLMSGGGQTGHQHAAEVTLVAGNENTHADSSSVEGAGKS
jgi:hypothetical protein